MASLSIITVALNSARHIGTAIQSLIRQEDHDFELILIDGQSVDGTIAIVESYRHVLKDRVRVVSERDSGIYDAMNKGLALAAGDVIGILNSDDEYLPGALATVRDTFETHRADIVFGDVLIGAAGGYAEPFEAHLAGMRERMTLAHPACFVHRSVYSAWGAFDPHFRLAGDYDFLLRCYLGGVRFVHVDRALARFTPGGASSKQFRMAREVYAIHARHLSRTHALRYFVQRISSAAFFGTRRSVAVTLLGHSRYERLRRRRHEQLRAGDRRSG